MSASQNSQEVGVSDFLWSLLKSQQQVGLLNPWELYAGMNWLLNHNPDVFHPPSPAVEPNPAEILKLTEIIMLLQALDHGIEESEVLEIQRKANAPDLEVLVECKTANIHRPRYALVCSKQQKSKPCTQHDSHIVICVQHSFCSFAAPSMLWMCSRMWRATPLSSLRDQRILEWCSRATVYLHMTYTPGCAILHCNTQTLRLSWRGTPWGQEWEHCLLCGFERSVGQQPMLPFNPSANGCGA